MNYNILLFTTEALAPSMNYNILMFTTEALAPSMNYNILLFTTEALAPSMYKLLSVKADIIFSNTICHKYSVLFKGCQ